MKIEIKDILYGIGIIIALIIGIAGYYGGTFGGTTHYTGPVDSEEGFSVDGTTIIDGSGNVDGSITSDTGTFSSTLDVDGAFTASSTVTVSESASTTLIIGKGVSGCLEMGFATSGHAIYIYPATSSLDTGGGLIATTTKPGFCK